MFSPLRPRTRQAVRKANRQARRRTLSLEALEDRRLMAVTGWGSSTGANPGYADPPPMDDNGSAYTDVPSWGSSQPGMEPLGPGENGYVDPGNQDWRGLKKAAESDANFTDSVESPTIGVLPGLPMLNSNPRATHTIYLNFTGGRMTSLWNPTGFPNVDLGKHHAVFDMDGDASRFSDAEADAIYRIWKYVADDYAPFDVNVTTVNNDWNPSMWFDNVLEVPIGGWIPRNEAGEGLYGVAHFNKYGDFGEDAAFVFSDRHKDTAVALYDDAQGAYEFFVKAVAGTAAHETAHAFGLEHQSWFSPEGEMVKEYRPAATTSHGTQAAIMGKSFREDGGPESRNLWAEGLNAKGVWQSDVQVLAARLGLRADDRPDDTYIDMPQLSPGHFYTQGTIGANDGNPNGADVDWFSFFNPGGPVNVRLNSPAGAFGNLHSKIELWNMQTNERVQVSAVEAPVNGFGFLHLPAGQYMLGVTSTGGYGNLGNYELEVGAYGSAGGIKVPGPLGAIVDVSGSAFAMDFGSRFLSTDGMGAARTLIPMMTTAAASDGEEAPLAGDFTGNGQVDGRDFLAWQLNFGATEAAAFEGDATGEGLVDGGDLTTWESEFGSGAPLEVAYYSAPVEGDLDFAPPEAPGDPVSDDEAGDWAPADEFAPEDAPADESSDLPAEPEEWPADDGGEETAGAGEEEPTPDFADGVYGLEDLDAMFAAFA